MTECSDKPLLTAASIPGVTLPLIVCTSHLSHKQNQDLGCSEKIVMYRTEEAGTISYSVGLIFLFRNVNSFFFFLN